MLNENDILFQLRDQKFNSCYTDNKTLHKNIENLVLEIPNHLVTSNILKEIFFKLFHYNHFAIYDHQKLLEYHSTFNKIFEKFKNVLIPERMIGELLQIDKVHLSVAILNHCEIDLSNKPNLIDFLDNRLNVLDYIVSKDSYKFVSYNEVIRKRYQPDYYDFVNKLYYILFKKYKLVNLELCNKICETHNEHMAEYLFDNNLFVANDNSLSYAFKGGSYYIISQLCNLKLIPKKEHILLLNRSMSSNTLESILDLMILIGIDIREDIIDFSIKMNTPINLEKYNIKIDNKFYFDIYKKYGMCLFANKTLKIGRSIKNQSGFQVLAYYVSKLPRKIIKFRQSFLVLNLMDIQSLISKTKMKPDQYCYDFSFLNNDNSVTEWLEKTYGFKPTIYTLINLRPIKTQIKSDLMNDLYEIENKKRLIVSKYFLNPNTYHSVNSHEIEKLYCI